MAIVFTDWIGESTSTIGTGDITLGGTLQGFSPMKSASAGEIYYTIVDGLNKETGIGTFDGNNVLARTTVIATLIDGVFTPSGSPLDLSGNAQVFGTVNSATMNKMFELIGDVSDKIDNIGKTTIGSLPPSGPVVDGTLWYCTTDGHTYIWYSDVDSGQWVDMAPQNEEQDNATNVFLHYALSNANASYRSATLYTLPVAEGFIQVTHNTLNNPILQAQFLRDESLWSDVYVTGAQGVLTVQGYTSGDCQLKVEILAWQSGSLGALFGQSDWVTIPSQSAPIYIPVALSNLDILDVGDSYVIKLTSKMISGTSATSTIQVDGDTASRFGIIFDSDLISIYDGIRDGIITSAPTENAVYDVLSQQSGVLTQVAGWSDVPMYSTSGLGGIDGPMNAQAKSLVARTELLKSGGGDFTQAGTGSVNRTAQNKMRETMSIADKGAVPAVDCATALINAGSSTTGAILIPAGDFIATATTSNSAAILGLLDRIRCDGTLTINLSAGVHSYTQQIVINSPDAQRIKVLGAATVTTTITGQVGVSGAAKNWTVNLSVASSAGIAVGDYVTIRTDVAGTGDFYAHAGIWKVTAVDSGGANRISVLNTCHKTSFPTNTITGGTVVALKTVAKFTGCDGFRFEGGQPLGELDRIAIVGDYVVATASGTTGAHGIIVSSPVVTPGNDSNDVFNPGGLVSVGPSVGVSGFGEQGIAISGRGSMVANFVASCSNRKRGWYAEGGNIRAKLGVGSGNGEDGYISDTSGYIQAALCIASGNGLNGFWSTNLSLLACGNAKATSNLSNGFETRGNSRTGGDLCLAMNNSIDGFSASDGGMIDADNATATSNGRDGFREVNNSTIDCNNSSSTNNGGFGYNGQNLGLINAVGSGSVSGNTSGSYNVLNDAYVIGVDGVVVPGTVRATTDIKILNSATNLKGARFTSTSIGDLVIGIDSAGAGTFTSLYVLKADGTQHPNNDNTQSLGRVANRYQHVFATIYHPGDGSPQWSAGSGSPEGVITAVVGSMRTRTDGGAGTTLYIKETGTGNTGWVAK